MTPTEAISIIETAIGEVEWNYPLDYSIAFEEAIKALKKQVPKMPQKYRAFDGIYRSGCPCCPTNEILYTNQKFCSVCGQAIDWGGYKIYDDDVRT